MHPLILPTLKVTRVLSYLALMTILVLAFGFDVGFIIRYWPVLMCGVLAISTACDTFLGMSSGTLSVAAVTIRRAAQPRVFLVMAGVNFLLSATLAGVGIHLLIQRLP